MGLGFGVRAGIKARPRVGIRIRTRVKGCLGSVPRAALT